MLEFLDPLKITLRIYSVRTHFEETHQKWDDQLSELMSEYGDNEDGAWPTKALLVRNGSIEFFDN